MKTPYDGYDVLDKWDSPSFNTLTRGVLARRMHVIPQPRFFDADAFRLLEAVCARLIPQPERTEPVPIAPFIDADLSANVGEGFRRPDMPPAAKAWRQGLTGIDAEARHRYVRTFVELDPDSQDATLTAIQKGEAAPASFGDMSGARFFQELLLNAAVGVYYSHPTAWSEMGFGGPASPRGYVRLGLDERDPWEPRLAPPTAVR